MSRRYIKRITRRASSTDYTMTPLTFILYPPFVMILSPFLFPLAGLNVVPGSSGKKLSPSSYGACSLRDVTLPTLSDSNTVLHSLHLSFSNQLSSVPRACVCHIHGLALTTTSSILTPHHLPLLVLKLVQFRCYKRR